VYSELKGFCETEQEWFFYIIRCSDDSLYSGITNDLKHRVKEHNSGKGAKYTLNRRPVVLVYSEKCAGISEARKREAQVKKWSKKNKERLVGGLSP